MARREKRKITAVVLAGGYATRLYPITLNVSKPLLPIGEKSIIDFSLEQLDTIAEVEKIFVITNDKFYRHYCEWTKKISLKKKIAIINDKTKTDKERLGSVGDMYYALIKKQIKNDLLVIGGDNIFENYLASFVQFAQAQLPAISIGVYDVGSKLQAKNYGVVKLDEDHRVLEFVEKPENPPSSLIAMCLYYFPKDTLSLLEEYVAQLHLDTDKAGFYIRWLLGKTAIYGFRFQGVWLDIGKMDTYKQAQHYFGKRTTKA